MPANRRATFGPEICNRVIDTVRAGNYWSTAAAAAGVHRATLYTWMAKGEEATEGPFRDFYERMCEAEALAEIDAVAAVREAKQGWQAHITFLERRHSERWSRRETQGQDARERRRERPE